jgi:hypothetical protein
MGGRAYTSGNLINLHLLLHVSLWRWRVFIYMGELRRPRKISSEVVSQDWQDMGQAVHSPQPPLPRNDKGMHWVSFLHPKTWPFIPLTMKVQPRNQWKSPTIHSTIGQEHLQGLFFTLPRINLKSMLPFYGVGFSYYVSTTCLIYTNYLIWFPKLLHKSSPF